MWSPCFSRPGDAIFMRRVRLSSRVVLSRAWPCEEVSPSFVTWLDVGALEKERPFCWARCRRVGDFVLSRQALCFRKFAFMV